MRVVSLLVVSWLMIACAAKPAPQVRAVQYAATEEPTVGITIYLDNAPAGVGALQLSIMYDPGLDVVDCIPDKLAWDLAICNVVEPGLAKFAGISARGIMAQPHLVVMDLPVHNQSISSDVKIYVDVMTDTDGSPISYTTKAGRITAQQPTSPLANEQARARD